MNTSTSQIRTYLNHLNLQLEKPTYEYLERICTSHLNTFPFENISKLVYFRDNNYDNFGVPNQELFLKNYSTHYFGGTCYTLNSNLYLLLKELGFNCYFIMLGNEHMGIIAEIEGERYYVDCGAAAPFFKPISFENNPDNITKFASDEVHLLPIDSQNHSYKYVRYTNGNQNGSIWHFNSRKAAKMSDFDSVIEKSNKADAPFMTFLRCQLFQIDKQRSVSLVNNKLGIRYSNGETVTNTLSSVIEIQQVLTEEFQLPNLPVEEAVSILQYLNIDIFSE